MPERPPLIRTDSSNAFAHNTMSVRVPGIIREVSRLNPDYAPRIHAALEDLARSIAENTPIPPLDPLGPDVDLWAEAYSAHAGHHWLQTDWFFAEIYFYRLLMQTVRWWETGRDPFTPKKAAELANGELWELMEQALRLRGGALDERLQALIHLALWGNRVDLSFATSLGNASSGSHEDLLVNDDIRAVTHLLRTSGEVHIIADNTGTELAMDFALIDALLDTEVRRVVLHLKMHPTFVSDATVADALALLDACHEPGRGLGTEDLSRRLRAALEVGRLRFAPDFFWNSSRFLWELPPRLRDLFAGAGLVISKGDANYRRLIGDAYWPSETPFAHVLDYMPCATLALRTLKSDAIVGLPAGEDVKLDPIDPHWRVNGRRGIIQFRA
ncbi:MAG: protein-glutamate O-methyltransferase family protein [Anaerolineae bacterium]|nr:protein-glutamate O-methyltransferase family protein [Anaerolineae bacterium]